MPKSMPRIRPDEEFVLHAEDDDFPLHPPKGPRRFVAPPPLWRRILVRPSLYIAPVIVGAAIAAFMINALLLQSGPRGAMTLGWPFNAISKASLDTLRAAPVDQPLVPMPPKRSDAGGSAPLAVTAAPSVKEEDPLAGLIKSHAGDPAIERAQRVLNRLGYGPVPVDGTMSPALRAALQRFGQDRGLTPGAQTESAVLKQLGHVSESAQN